MSVSAHRVRGSDPSTKRTVEVRGFGRRLVATLFDGLLVLFLTTLLAVLLTLVVIVGSSYGRDEVFPFNLALAGVGLAVSLVYYVGFWSRKGQTIGKEVMGIKLVGEDGSLPSWGKALLRYIGYIISGVVLSLGFVWIAIDSKRQGWHDKLAGTYAINDEHAFNDVDAVIFSPDDPDRGWVWLVLWIVAALGVPGALLVGLWPLGPSINKAVTDFIQNLV